MAAFAENESVYCPVGVAVVLLTVTVTLIGLPVVGLTLADGEKLQAMPVAGVLQLNSTVAEKDPNAPTCTVNCEPVPGNSVIDAGAGVPNVKSTTLTVVATWWVVVLLSLPTP